ncbi:restriction endonuclease [Brevibacillus brevis]|uniref:restriction endonuclease n=1 Tax=Brevibacillus brevis TaxID=1393 RepID=UPI0025A66E8F|nr:restriction endonuclease [Brevibacillus brevis]WJQ81013.1 restriction endonuclease [Brevibacillus brevis]
MVMPSQTEIEKPLLQTLYELGGQANPQQVYSVLRAKFPELTQEDLEETLISGGNKWTNRIQWVRQKLITKGDMSSPQRGIWAITDQGRNKITIEQVESTPQLTNLVELYDNYEDNFRTQLLEKLYELSPRQFEEFSKKLLHAYGFINLHVTEVGPDGGIDGYGKLKIGLASMNVAFQCKRWQSNNVGRREIQQFRGAIQGRYEQGIFFTTSNFTDQAKDISFQQGAVPIILMNGESIVDLMIEKGFGVIKKPLFLYYEKFQDVLDE